MKAKPALRRFYACFDSSIGPCGLLWNSEAIERVQLPEKTPALTKRRLIDRIPLCEELALDRAPAWVQDAVYRLQTLLRTGQADLSTIPIDLAHSPPFFRLVLTAARGIAPGQTTSYGELAKLVGSPAAARAVGQAMGRNPLPLIVPCHRVRAAGGKLGGFSAFGGVVTKQQLLAIESAGAIDWNGAYGEALAQAVAILQANDPVLAALIDRVGPCALEPRHGSAVFAALCSAIIYQQLHGKAAATILGRFRALFPGEDFPQPAAVLAASDEVLRSAGLSGAKTRSIKDLAAKILAGSLPEMSQLATMSDEAVIASLTQVRGIGPWTAEMLLIFDLGRLDILPLSDYGVRKGFAMAFRKRELPSPEALAQHGERWRPFRSLACWYLWRAADMKTI